jgi:putative ABC transport system substrate-binding protein
LNLVVAATAAWAQQPNKVPIVGYLAVAADPDNPDNPLVETWRQGLRELGYVEGRNIRIEFRTAQGDADRLPRLAQELVQLNVNVIVAASPLAALSLKRATSTIPIVIALGDPLAYDLVTNLAHPGGNVTGLSSMTNELSAKRLELLKETIPRITRVAFLWNPATPPTAAEKMMVENLRAAAHSLSIELKFVLAQAPEEFGTAFSAVSRAHAQALLLHDNPLFYVHREALAKWP